MTVKDRGADALALVGRLRRRLPWFGVGQGPRAGRAHRHTRYGLLLARKAVTAPRRALRAMVGPDDDSSGRTSVAARLRRQEETAQVTGAVQAARHTLPLTVPRLAATPFSAAKLVATAALCGP